METKDTVKIEMTGGGLNEHIAVASDGRRMLRRGSSFDAVNKDGYLVFDEVYARQTASKRFNEELPDDAL